MAALSGDDIMIGTSAGIRYGGYDGYDILDYSAFGQGVVISEIDGGIRFLDGTVIGTIAAGAGIEEFDGSAFNDVLATVAGGSAATLHGNAGDDTLIASATVELLDGGADTDTVSYTNSAAGVTVDLRLAGAQVSAGAASGDTLTGIENLIGSVAADTLHGDAGANRLAGGTGDDVLNGHDGSDVLVGGAGADQLVGEAGSDTADYSASAAGVTVNLAAGTGLGGDAQGDTLATIENVTGSALADTLYGDGNANALAGGAGDDSLRGGAGADTLDGGDGIDTASYRGSLAVAVDLLNHTASGGDAAGDTLTAIENLTGSSFADQLAGDGGRNVISGDNGADTLAGNGGDDLLAGGSGDDSLDGGDGADRLVGDDGVDTIHGGAGNNSIDAGTGSDQVFGEAGQDSILGGAGDDRLDGGEGNDTLDGGSGADVLTGGGGIDTVSYAGSATGVTLNLATGASSGGDAQGDTLSGIEQVLGSDQIDIADRRRRCQHAVGHGRRRRPHRRWRRRRPQGRGRQRPVRLHRAVRQRGLRPRQGLDRGLLGRRQDRPVGDRRGRQRGQWRHRLQLRHRRLHPPCRRAAGGDVWLDAGGLCRRQRRQGLRLRHQRHLRPRPDGRRFPALTRSGAAAHPLLSAATGTAGTRC